MPEKPPVDKYSRAAYEEGLRNLSEHEEQIKNHPLQGELALHKELRKDSVSPYPFRDDEERAKASLEAETAGIRREIEVIKRDLLRQLGNAQAEATRTNDKMESKEWVQAVLPQIIKIEDSTHHTLDDSRNLSRRAQVFGQAVLEEAEATKQKITAKKPTAAPETIQTSFRLIQELYRQFVDMAGNVLVQDRYGHGAGEAGA